MVPPRVVLDSSVVRAGFVSSLGASRQLLLKALDGEIAAVASTALMLQYEDVLTRPATLADASVPASDATDFLDALCGSCVPVAIDVLWRPQSPDPGDDLVIDAAVNGSASLIATYDLRHLRAPAALFGIAAETPAHILRRII